MYSLSLSVCVHQSVSPLFVSIYCHPICTRCESYNGFVFVFSPNLIPSPFCYRVPPWFVSLSRCAVFDMLFCVTFFWAEYRWGKLPLCFVPIISRSLLCAIGNYCYIPNIYFCVHFCFFAPSSAASTLRCVPDCVCLCLPRFPPSFFTALSLGSSSGDWNQCGTARSPLFIPPIQCGLICHFWFVFAPCF